MGPDAMASFLLTAGMMSGFGSYVLKVVTSLPAASLGASGKETKCS